jgi:hypothetical protein
LINSVLLIFLYFSFFYIYQIDYPELEHAVQNNESVKRIGSKHNRQQEQAVASIDEHQTTSMDSGSIPTIIRKKNNQTRHVRKLI